MKYILQNTSFSLIALLNHKTTYLLTYKLFNKKLDIYRQHWTSSMLRHQQALQSISFLFFIETTYDILPQNMFSLKRWFVPLKYSIRNLVLSQTLLFWVALTGDLTLYFLYQYVIDYLVPDVCMPFKNWDLKHSHSFLWTNNIFSSVLLSVLSLLVWLFIIQRGTGCAFFNSNKKNALVVVPFFVLQQKEPTIQFLYYYNKLIKIKQIPYILINTGCFWTMGSHF